MHGTGRCLSLFSIIYNSYATPQNTQITGWLLENMNMLRTNKTAIAQKLTDETTVTVEFPTWEAVLYCRQQMKAKSATYHIPDESGWQADRVVPFLL